MLDERVPYARPSLEKAAWAGLQDSMPRAALLSIHARIEGTNPLSWDDPAFVQVWGPRFNVYVVAQHDVAIFTLGRLSDDPAAIEKAHEMAALLDKTLSGERMTLSEAGASAGIHHSQFRYATPTGTVLIRWEGAGATVIWTVPPPDVDPVEARSELARRHLHIQGPATAASFSEWAGIKPRRALRTYETLKNELAPVRTPAGEAFILCSDEVSFLAGEDSPTPVRLLPSGDAYWLLGGAERDLLVPDSRFQAELWTPRVWPGALLMGGEIVGTWRRAQHKMTVRPWRKLSALEREEIEIEAVSMPLPDLRRDMDITWGTSI